MDATPLSLIDRLRRPEDQRAWDRFVELFTPLIAKWVERFHVPVEDRDDLIQEVFLILLKRLPHFTHQAGGSFRAWLWTVTRNATRDWYSARKPAGPLLAEPAVADFADEVLNEEFCRYLVGRTLKIIQTDFQPAIWQAFWKVTVEERPSKEVATELNLSVNSVYLARSRVLARLRQEMEGMWEE